MKTTLIILIFGLFLHCTSALFWHAARENGHPKQVTTTPMILHTSLNSQQPNRSNDLAQRFRQGVLRVSSTNSSRAPLQRVLNEQQQTAPVKRNNSSLIPRNRFPVLLYQRQQPNRPLNSTNNRVLNQRFRSMSGNSLNRRVTPAASSSKPKSSSATKNNNQPSREYPRASAAANKQTRLLSALHTKTDHKSQKDDQIRQGLLAKAYYHEQLRDYYRQLYEQQSKNSAPKHKRQADGSNAPQADAYSMIFARGVPSNNKK